MQELLLMRSFCEKYGVKQYTVSKRINEYQTQHIDGYAKPRIIDNQFNRELAEKHRNMRPNRPLKGQLPIDQFCAKYGIDRSRIEVRYRSLEKVFAGDTVLIKETRSNLRHCKLIT
jgi:hypothetical protein